MSAPYPGTDSRRKQDLLLELETAARRFLPAWRGLTEPDDPGRALLQIGADLAEHVTSRLDRTGERDLKAFLNWLDQEGPSPRSAEAWLVLTLSDKLDDPVQVRERVQIGAPGPDGDEIIFETPDDLALTLTPARLQAFFSVDPSADRIETAPASFGSLEPPRASDPPFSLLSFAGEASPKVQITPPVGLEKGDWIRINDAAYEIADEKDGIYTIEPGLDAPAAAGTEVERITRFTPGLMRDLQRHILYVGHKELFNLEQAAAITLHVVPGNSSSFFSGREIAWELFGTRNDTKETGWHPLEAAVGTSSVSLRKSWAGKVDEVEVGSEKSRWLRARLLTPMIEAPFTFPRDRIELNVRSEKTANGQGSTTGGEEAPIDPPTVSAAFHNATPLPVNGRFLPFGPEPRLFDQFYLAAPEVLSKKGARAEIDIEIADASYKSAEGVVGTDGVFASFGIGGNGHLQVIRQSNESSLIWRDLGHPGSIEDADPSEPERAKFFLDSNRPPAVTSIRERDGNPRYAVAAFGKDGRLWFTIVTHERSKDRPTAASWQLIDEKPSAEGYDDILAFSHLPEAESEPDPAGYLFRIDIDNQGLRRYRIEKADTVSEDQFVQNKPGPAPAFGRQTRLVAQQHFDWPKLQGGPVYGVFLIDQNGSCWLGEISGEEAAWTAIDPNLLSPSPNVRPAALRAEANAIFLVTAETGETSVQIHKLQPGGTVSLGRSEPLNLVRGSAIRSLLHDTNGLILSLVQAESGSLLLNGTAGVETINDSPDLSGLTVENAWFARDIENDEEEDEEEEPLRIFLAGPKEAVFQRTMALMEVTAGDWRDSLTLHDTEGQTDTAHWVEISKSASGDTRMIGLEDAIIRDKSAGLRIYAFDQDSDPEKRLAIGDAYTFFWNGDPLAGRIVPSTSDQLELAEEDEETAEGTRIVIDGVLHEVTGVERMGDPAIATFVPDTTVTGEVSYQLLETDGQGGQVAASDLGSIVQIQIGENDDPLADGERLLFDTRFDPVLQTILKHRMSGSALNALINGAWTEQPEAEVAALRFSAVPPSWQAVSFERSYQNPELAWEYFDGAGWRRLQQGFVDETGHLIVSGDVRFKVPDDLAETRIGGQDDYWIRARLIGGDYGQPSFLVDATPIDVKPPDITEIAELQNLLFDQKVTIDRSALNPPEIVKITARFELDDQVSPELTMVDNNLALINQTAAAEADGAVFDLFSAAASIDPATSAPALYLGLSKAFTAEALRLLVDAAEKEGEVPLVWEVLSEGRWQEVLVDGDDPTKGLLRPGIITLRIDVKPTRQPLFGQALFWLRASPGNGAAWEPDLAGIYLNAAPAEQAQTLRNELLGSSIGEPNARFSLAEQPVLSGSLELRVRERPGSEERAALILAFGEDAIKSNEPDRPGDWVLWRQVPGLVDQTPDARVYTLDARSGLVRFGNGRQGRIPPAGADNLRAFKYRAGGGQGGNVAAFTIASLKSAVSGVEAVTNPLPSRGGSDGRSDDVSCDQAAATVRHVNRAIAPRDVEALALDFAPEIIRARCLRPEAAGAKLRVAIAADGDGRRIEPSIAMQDGLSAFLEERASSSWPEAGFDVTGPDLVPLTIEIMLVPAPGAAPALPLLIQDRLFAWLHPVTGGHAGQGWPFGRGVWSSDVHQALADHLGGASIQTLDLARKDGRGGPEAIGQASIVTIERDDIVIRLSGTAP